VADAGDQPIIIKRVKKGGGHGHHGGAWKVAYADFVTAMMAFFLLLWLLNSVTQEQLEGISNYFAPVSTSDSTSGSGDILGGTVIGDEGALQGQSIPQSVSVELPQPGPPGEGLDEEDSEAEPTEEDLDERIREREEQQFQEAEDTLRRAIAEDPDLQGLVNSLMIDNSQEGLRIQILDQEGVAMFPRGSSIMNEQMRRVLTLVSRVIEKMPQDVSISGHTDATRYIDDRGYTNWELSADRANAARRALIDLGVPDTRVARVVGMADREPLLADQPEAPANRRLSVVLLRGTGQQVEPVESDDEPF